MHAVRTDMGDGHWVWAARDMPPMSMEAFHGDLSCRTSMPGSCRFFELLAHTLACSLFVESGPFVSRSQFSRFLLPHRTFIAHPLA